MSPLAATFLTVLVCGVVNALLRAAPDSLIAQPYKSWLEYGVLVFAVLAVLAYFNLLPTFLSGFRDGMSFGARRP